MLTVVGEVTLLRNACLAVNAANAANAPIAATAAYCHHRLRRSLASLLKDDYFSPVPSPASSSGQLAGSDQIDLNASVSPATSPSPGVDGAEGGAAADGTTAGVAAGPPFEMLKSVVTDESTGELLTHEKVIRGSVRLETLTFRVSQPLKGLRRRTVTAKKFGFVFKVRIGCRGGRHEQMARATHVPHKCQTPPGHALPHTVPLTPGFTERRPRLD